MAWIAGASFVNPAAGDVLVDSGPLVSARYRAAILVSANPPGIEVSLQLTDSAGVVIVSAQVLPVTNGLLDVVIPYGWLVTRLQQRLRVVNVATLSGYTLGASLFLEDIPVV